MPQPGPPGQTAQIPLRLDPAIYAWLKDRAHAEDKHVVALVREGIDMLIDQRVRSGQARPPKLRGQIPGQAAIRFQPAVVDK